MPKTKRTQGGTATRDLILSAHVGTIDSCRAYQCLSF